MALSGDILCLLFLNQYQIALLCFFLLFFFLFSFFSFLILLILLLLLLLLLLFKRGWERIVAQQTVRVEAKSI